MKNKTRILLLLAMTTSVIALADDSPRPFGTATIQLGGDPYQWPVWTCSARRVSAHQNDHLNLASGEPYVNFLHFGDIIQMMLAVDGYSYTLDFDPETDLSSLEFTGEVSGTNQFGIRATKTFAATIDCDPEQ